MSPWPLDVPLPLIPPEGRPTRKSGAVLRLSLKWKFPLVTSRLPTAHGSSEGKSPALYTQGGGVGGMTYDLALAFQPCHFPSWKAAVGSQHFPPERSLALEHAVAPHVRPPSCWLTLPLVVLRLSVQSLPGFVLSSSLDSPFPRESLSLLFFSLL